MLIDHIIMLQVMSVTNVVNNVIRGLNKLEEEHFCFAFVSVRDPDSFGRIKPEPKGSRKSRK